MRLLVIDDYDTTRAALVRTLTAARFEVVEATSDSDLTPLVAGVALAVIDLPIGDAIEVATFLSREEAFRGVAIALIDPVEPLRAEARAAGIFRFLLRPCSPEQILKQTRAILAGPG